MPPLSHASSQSSRAPRYRESIVFGHRGFSLIETIVAAAVLSTAVVSVAQLFALAVRTTASARETTYASVLAAQKLEELRSLAWGVDENGLPITDLASDLTSDPVAPIGGTGLGSAPASAMQENTAGYVDYVDISGRKLGGGRVPPPNGAYIRRWRVQRLAIDPENALLLQVLVTRNRNRGAADDGAVGRLPEEARLVTVRMRRGS
jgi:prepilin-type N-terminal cleavage/methylation domain-containing protein